MPIPEIAPHPTTVRIPRKFAQGLLDLPLRDVASQPPEVHGQILRLMGRPQVEPQVHTGFAGDVPDGARDDEQ